MFQVAVKPHFSGLERALLDMSRELGKGAPVLAVTRTVALTRRAMRDEMPNIFDRPTPYTVNSVLYKAEKESPRAVLFIQDEGGKGVAPARYLRAEIEGGPRGDKRSERALISRGIMAPDQQMVPSTSARLDRYGNLPKGMMVRVLSRIGAFHEMGFAANAGAETKQRLARQRRAHRSTGTDFFVGANRDGRAGAVYQIVGSHHIRPVLVFTDRRATYKRRFNFIGLAGKSFGEIWPAQMRRAYYETMEKLGLKSK